jgi:hypothetical protein
MAHRPVVVELKTVEHLPSLPYREALETFTEHARECGPCAEAFESPDSICRDYCREGHELYHAVAGAVDRQHTLSTWN